MFSIHAPPRCGARRPTFERIDGGPHCSYPALQRLEVQSFEASSELHVLRLCRPAQGRQGLLPAIGQDEVRRGLMIGVVDEPGQRFIHQNIGNSLNVLTRYTEPARDLRHCFPTVPSGAEHLPSGWGLTDAICDGFATPPEGTGQFVNVRDEQWNNIWKRAHFITLSK
jgi:hypothetical protein